MDNNNNKILNSYIDHNNFQRKNNSSPPIDWMEIKNQINNNETLLLVPFSPLIDNIPSFKDAVYKMYFPLINSRKYHALNLIQNVYKNQSLSLLFTDAFYAEMNKLKDDTKITFIIHYDKDFITYSHLYFICLLDRAFYLEEADANKIIFTFNKSEINTPIDSSHNLQLC